MQLVGLFWHSQYTENAKNVTNFTNRKISSAFCPVSGSALEVQKGQKCGLILQIVKSLQILMFFLVIRSGHILGFSGAFEGALVGRSVAF